MSFLIFCKVLILKTSEIATSNSKFEEISILFEDLYFLNVIYYQQIDILNIQVVIKSINISTPYFVERY